MTRFSLLNFLFLIIAFSAIIAWRIDKSHFETVIANYSVDRPDSYRHEIQGNGVADAVSIPNIAFVYRISDVKPKRSARSNLTALGLLSDAEKCGRPGPELVSLIDEMLGYKTTLFLETAEAKNRDSKYFWKFTWSLFPANMGFSGQPYRYIGYVHPDGTSVKPQIYLRDSFGSWLSDADEIYSVLSLEALSPKTEIEIDQQKLIQIASQHLTNSLKNLGVETKFRFDQVARRTFSTELTSKFKGAESELEIWAVDFVDNSIPSSVENKNSATRLTVWVTSEFTTSRISTGQWQID